MYRLAGSVHELERVLKDPDEPVGRRIKARLALEPLLAGEKIIIDKAAREVLDAAS